MIRVQVRPTNIFQRQAYGLALADYGDHNPEVVVLEADVSSSTLTSYFAKRFPQRFFNFGVTEASMVDAGVGFALGGKIPFVNTFAALLTLRACEQIRTCVAYANVNVKLVGGFAGVSDYKDGATHYAINDIAIMRSLPNMVVLAPADATEVAKMVKLIAEYDSPVYMRISRAAVPDVFYEDYQPEIGKGVIVRAGSDVTLISTGSMLGRSLLAAQVLADLQVDVRVINLSTIKPIDRELVLNAAYETQALVTVEEHTLMGGLGSAVAESVVSNRPVAVEMVGIRDVFPETGPDPDTLLDSCGLSVQAIAEAVKKVLLRKE